MPEKIKLHTSRKLLMQTFIFHVIGIDWYIPHVDEFDECRKTQNIATPYLKQEALRQLYCTTSHFKIKPTADMYIESGQDSILTNAFIETKESYYLIISRSSVTEHVQ